MSATWRFFFLIAAVVLFILLALIGGGVFGDTAPDPETIWLLTGAGLASFAASFLGPWPRV